MSNTEKISASREFIQTSIDALPREWQKMVRSVTADVRFMLWPASLGKHHSYPGGLVVHTSEVLDFALQTQSRRPAMIDATVVTVAAIFHDYGKCWVYEQSREDQWVKSAHYEKSLHIARSHLEFSRLSAMFVPEHPDLCARIAHSILAHHGRREWGSPVEPTTPEAWAIHLADMTSVFCLGDRHLYHQKKDNG